LETRKLPINKRYR